MDGIRYLLGSGRGCGGDDDVVFDTFLLFVADDDACF
jgi:hypothetical protein